MCLRCFHVCELLELLLMTLACFLLVSFLSSDTGPLGTLESVFQQHTAHEKSFLKEMHPTSVDNFLTSG